MASAFYRFFFFFFCQAGDCQGVSGLTTADASSVSAILLSTPICVTTGKVRGAKVLLDASNANDDDDEVMLNVLRCQLTY